MSIMRWEPWAGLTRMRDEMDRMFQQFFGTPAEGELSALRVPSVDLSETNGELKLTVELPGVDKEHLEVQVMPEEVSIKGEVRKEEEKKDAGYLRRERRYGLFQRTIPLPVEIKPNEAKATFKDGVLTIELPKSEQAKRLQPVKVPIQS